MEEYREIPGTDGNYLISNKGNIYSRKTEKVMKPKITKDGYQFTGLRVNGRAVWVRYHRLVAEAFIPNPDNLETVNHKDGNKQNNNVSNLEWMDRNEQMRHAYSHGLKKPARGDLNGNAKITNEQAEAIRQEYVRYSKKFGTVALARKYGLSNVAVGKIVRGEAYV